MNMHKYQPFNNALRYALHYVVYNALDMTLEEIERKGLNFDSALTTFYVRAQQLAEKTVLNTYSKVDVVFYIKRHEQEYSVRWTLEQAIELRDTLDV